MSYQKIINHLYLGGSDFIFERELPHFDFIINLCPDINCNYSKINHDKVLYIKISDSSDQNDKLINILKTQKILQQMYTYITQKKNVMVHCAMGKSRSASLVACYLINYHRCTMENAVKFIRQRRNECFDNGLVFLDTMKYIENNKYN